MFHDKLLHDNQHYPLPIYTLFDILPLSFMRLFVVSFILKLVGGMRLMQAFFLFW